MKDKIHPKYIESEIRCACGNIIKTRSTKPSIMVGICNVCHPFYTGTQKFVDTAGRVDKFQPRMPMPPPARKRGSSPFPRHPPAKVVSLTGGLLFIPIHVQEEAKARRIPG